MSGSYDEYLLKHYQRVAQNFGTNPQSTMGESYIRQRETEFIVAEIKAFTQQMPPENQHVLEILDMGCGNGYLLSILQKEFPQAKLNGREFTPELLDLAQSRQLPNVDIAWGDCRESDFFPYPVDLIISERVLINIKDSGDQQKVLGHISRLLKRKGRYIMVESFKEPLVNLNRAAQEMKLDHYKESLQNLYLSEPLLEILPLLGLEERKAIWPTNTLSTHFFLTRILHPALRPVGGRVKDSEFVRFFNQALPPAVGNFSPILFRVFTKI